MGQIKEIIHQSFYLTARWMISWNIVKVSHTLSDRYTTHAFILWYKTWWTVKSGEL